MLTLNATGKVMGADYTELAAQLDALDAKVKETKETLIGLATAVVASNGSQTAVDALAAKAKAILDELSAAEDSADDALA